MYRFADHEDEAARVVVHRSPGQHHWMRAPAVHPDASRPINCLCDDPDMVAFQRLVIETPALTAAHTRYLGRSEAALTTALCDAVPRAEQTGRLPNRRRAARARTRESDPHLRRPDHRCSVADRANRGQAGLRPTAMASTAPHLVGPCREAGCLGRDKYPCRRRSLPFIHGSQYGIYSAIQQATG